MQYETSKLEVSGNGLVTKLQTFFSKYTARQDIVKFLIFLKSDDFSHTIDGDLLDRYMNTLEEGVLNQLVDQSFC